MVCQESMETNLRFSRYESLASQRMGCKQRVDDLPWRSLVFETSLSVKFIYMLRLIYGWRQASGHNLLL
jgi:hypothetical protein